ncbi:MAG: iron chaperone [Akkermansiaceae bacterium]
MASEKPQTVQEYINAAPSDGQPHLLQLLAILNSVAEQVEGAESLLKWNTPFFIEPRFMFAFAAFKAHLGLTPTQVTMDHFRDKVAPYKTTKHMIQIRYNQEINENLIREIAEHCVKTVKAREDDSFW